MIYISTVHPEFEGMGVSAIDTTEGIIAGRPCVALCTPSIFSLTHVNLHF